MALRIDIGEPANDAETVAFAFLANALPASFTVFTNPTLVNASGVAREVDAVIAAPHALFVVEVKSWSGRIEGTDYDWYVPHPVPSPVPKNRQTAQMLATELRKRTYEAGRAWVQGLVFLSHTTEVGELGPLSRDRVVTRRTVIDALTNPATAERLSGRRSLAPVTSGLLDELTRLLQAPTKRPRRIREFDLVEQLEGTDRYAEHAATHRLTDEKRLLRVYGLPPDASPERRERLHTRVKWEAQVLRRLGRHPNLLDADAPFDEEAGLVLPLEDFRGITLSGWLARHTLPNLADGITLWERIVRPLAYAHEHGVIHRLLRPEAIRLLDEPIGDGTPDLRVTDFDLAKQLDAGVTVTWTTVPDERRRWSAPEVLQSFSDADHRSDQFSLGALLGFIVTGKPLFASTADLVRDPHGVKRVRDTTLRVPASLDLAVARMLSVRPADRFPSLDDAVAAVRGALSGRVSSPAPPHAPDPEDLQPGERAGDDYLIEARLGEGGSGVVYAARHRLSGAVHVLKVAKPGHEAALTAEFQALHRLDHAHIVRPITVSRMLEDRVTLVMERAGSQTLGRWLRTVEQPVHANTLRRFADDLFGMLAYLEGEVDVVHKDLKPDNLLVRDDGGLVLIDFSAVDAPEREPFAGTPAYRDPAWTAWTHATDRYAAMLVLFEIYVGRHPFGGQAPEPEATVAVDASELDATGLVDFFATALHPDASRRPSSAVSLRQTFVASLANEALPAPAVPAANTALQASTPVNELGLPNRAVNQLRRSDVLTAEQLVGLDPSQIFAIRAVGAKTARAILEVRQRLLDAGVQPAVRPSSSPALLPTLAADGEPLTVLGQPPGVTDRLVDAGFTTVADVAVASREALLAVQGIGPGKLTALQRGLHRRADLLSGLGDLPDLQALFDRLVAPLTDRQRAILDFTVGMSAPALRQTEIASQLGTHQSEVSRQLGLALDEVDRRVFEIPRDYVVRMVEELGGGLMRVDEAKGRLLEKWEGQPDQAEAWLRLVARLASDRLVWLESDLAEPVLARAVIEPGQLVAFVKEARHQAKWEPDAAENTRRALRHVLPEDLLPGDPLTVAVRLLDDLATTDRGELFEHPVAMNEAIDYALKRERVPLSKRRLREVVLEAFGPNTPFPEPSDLARYLPPLVREEADMLVEVDLGSVQVDIGPPDPLPASLVEDPGEQVARMLEALRERRGLRMVVVPPAQHRAITASIGRRLGVQPVSFAGAWFDDHHDHLDRLEKAERFKAQRRKLTRAAESTFAGLLQRHGQPDTVTVVGDLGILGVLDALDLVRRWYDEAGAGQRGCWVLVIPGVIRDRQPFFNGQQQVFHLDGVTWPLPTPVPESR